MEYVIPVVIVVLIITGFVTFMVLNATRKSGPVADSGDEGAPGMGPDDTPLGDTSQHAGEQRGDGTTAHRGERHDDEPERPASERLGNADR